MSVAAGTADGPGTRVLGIAAVLSVVAIYSANFVATRYSVLQGLTPFDLVALRYAVAGGLLLPYVSRSGFRDLGGIGWPKGLALGCLAGSPYMVVFFSGLGLAPAAHGAVLNPGVVPFVVFLFLVFSGRQRFSPARAAALTLVLAGLVLVTGASFFLRGSVLAGDLLLLATGVSWGVFTVLIRLWALRPMQAAAVVSVVSLAYLPPYLLFGYDGFHAVSTAHVVSQAFFQGVVNSIATVYLLTYAVHALGAQVTALFSPLVPILTTLAAAPLLGEHPTPAQWIGVTAVVAGMLGAGFAR